MTRSQLVALLAFLATGLTLIAIVFIAIFFHDAGLIEIRVNVPTIMLFKFNENHIAPSGLDWHGRIFSEIENEIRRTPACLPYVRYIHKDQRLWTPDVRADVVIYGRADDTLSIASAIVYSPKSKEEKTLTINYRTSTSDYDHEAIYKMTWESIGIAFDMLAKQTGDSSFLNSAAYVRKLSFEKGYMIRGLYSCERK